MNPSIPASQLVNVIPSVLGAGGNPLSLNAVFLTGDPSIPIGTVQAFTTLAAVQAWFGATSPEATLAAVYFSGFIGATTLPGTLYFAQYNTTAVAGYARGGSFSGTSFANSGITALTPGSLVVSIDGVVQTSLSVNFSAAVSYSNAASILQTALDGGSPGTAATVTYDSQRQAFVITSSTTGASSSVGFSTVGTISTGLKLTSAAGAVLSPGAVTAVPATLMATVAAQNQNWATFMTVTEPDDTHKLAFAAWVNGTNARYAYIVPDSNAAPLAGPASGSFGALTASATGVCPVYDPTGKIGAFICGAAASIDFEATQGRITFAYKSQAGLPTAVTDATSAANLISNGYNFYGAYATANQAFQFLQPGLVSGSWLWLDEYINQIWLNNALQLALVELLANTKSIPYNNQGYSLIRAACLDPINAALNAGVIQPGVALSAAQVQELNTAAGTDAATPVQQLGWYLQILPAPALTRAARGSPPMTLWYTDGGSVQKINLASIDIQ